MKRSVSEVHGLNAHVRKTRARRWGPARRRRVRPLTVAEDVAEAVRDSKRVATVKAKADPWPFGMYT